ncbi:MAG TPA: hypothetical protein PKW82_08625, partial [Spirochaetales bacterium]|nr:hypothetical protein [Spirochaetales bacterium]
MEPTTASSGMTATRRLAETPGSETLVAVIMVTPLDSAVTVPEASTFATAGTELDQVTSVTVASVGEMVAAILSV